MPEPVRPRRLVAGLAAMVATSIALSWVLGVLWPTDGLDVVAVVEQSVAVGSGALVGGWIARAGLLPLAVAMWAVQWAVLAQVLARVAGPDANAGGLWTRVLLQNQDAIAATLLATIAGVWFGQRLARRRRA